VGSGLKCSALSSQTLNSSAEKRRMYANPYVKLAAVAAKATGAVTTEKNKEQKKTILRIEANNKLANNFAMVLVVSEYSILVGTT